MVAEEEELWDGLGGLELLLWLLLLLLLLLTLDFSEDTSGSSDHGCGIVVVVDDDVAVSGAFIARGIRSKWGKLSGATTSTAVTKQPP